MERIVPDVKSKFTLHTDYVYKPGQNNKIPMAVLSPHIRGSVEFAIVIAMSAVFLIIALCSLFLLPMLAYIQRIDYQLLHEGHEIPALVTTCDQFPDSSAFYTYTYTVANVVYEGSDSLREPCAAHPIGSTITAVYHNSDPAESRINFDLMRSNQNAFGPLILLIGAMIIGGLVFLWIMGIYMKRYLYARRHHRDLVTNTQVLQGEITAINGHTPYPSGTYYIQVWYTFETPRKTIVKGFAEAHRQDLKDKELPPVGTPITVVYADNGSHMML
jgi:hypothetical protein